MGQSDRNYISQEITKIWKETAPEHRKEVSERSKGCDFWICIFCILAICCIGICCLIPYLCLNAGKMYQAQSKWRQEFIQNMKNFIHNDLKKKYPNLIFTLIYPICIWDKKVTGGKHQHTIEYISQLMCYIRVSNAPLPISDSYEPIIDSTDDGTTANNNNNNNNNGTTVIVVQSPQLQEEELPQYDQVGS